MSRAILTYGVGPHEELLEMCRGHLANQVLADVLSEPKHGAFI